MVIEGRAGPSWSAISRALRPPASRTLAVVFRRTWLVAQPKPALSKASRRSAAGLEGARRVLRGAANTGGRAFSGPGATSDPAGSPALDAVAIVRRSESIVDRLA